MIIRPIKKSDRQSWIQFRSELYEADEITMAQEADQFYTGHCHDPHAVFVAEENNQLIGMVELSTRSHAEGCSTHPVAYLEGWYVIPEKQGQGVGKELLKCAEGWAKEMGCTQMASDALVTNLKSQTIHEKLGFEKVETICCYKKDLS